MLPRHMMQHVKVPSLTPLQRYTSSGSSEDSGSDSDDDMEKQRLVYGNSGTDSTTNSSTHRTGGPGWLVLGGKRSTRSRSRPCKCIAIIVVIVAGIVMLGTAWHLVSGAVGPSSESWLSSNNLNATFGRHSYHGHDLKPISLEHLANGTFTVQRESLDWLPEAGDGVYSYKIADGSIVLEDLNANKTRMLVDGDKILDSDGRTLEWQKFKVSADLKYILFAANTRKQWRHSTLANYYIHDLRTDVTKPLPIPSAADGNDDELQQSRSPHTALVCFSPTEHHVAFVHANDLFVLEQRPGETSSGQVVRVTRSGSPTTFNGVPDWVYEEEVFSADSALWWSPDGQQIAFLSFDEQDVPEYELPIYNPSTSSEAKSSVLPYPGKVVMRYPKPGYANPIVNIHVFDLASYLSSSKASSSSDSRSSVEQYTYTLIFPPLSEDKASPEPDRIVSEVAWVSDRALLVKTSDRGAQHVRVGLFKLDDDTLQDRLVGESNEIMGQVVRSEDYAARDGGWAEMGQFVVGLHGGGGSGGGTSDLSGHFSREGGAYLDILPDERGYNHLALFAPLDATEPVFLTRGAWDLDGGVRGLDLERELAYVSAANPSTTRQIYSVEIPRDKTAIEAVRRLAMTVNNVSELAESGVVALTPWHPDGKLEVKDGQDDKSGYYRANFSPGAGWYVLDYDGPGVPWQRLVKVGDPSFDHMLVDNAKLKKDDAGFMQVKVVMGTVKVNGAELNTRELRPPMMDESGRTKYPVLFNVYGGPVSQTVSTRWQRDVHHHLATTHGYIVVQVDPRGTGFRGRNFSMPVRGQLGSLEAEDVVAAAREWGRRTYVDKKRIGIWGWSYGGFLTTKVVETNSSVFDLAMAVAPVTDWRTYDTIYTERYMSTPQLNPVGYRESSIRHMDGFRHVHFALAHGSADDNVHFLNSAALLDRLTSAHVRDFRFRMFTDSDHGIAMRGSYWELMHWLVDFVVEHWGAADARKLKDKFQLGEWADEGRKHAVDTGRDGEGWGSREPARWSI